MLCRAIVFLGCPVPGSNSVSLALFAALIFILIYVDSELTGYHFPGFCVSCTCVFSLRAVRSAFVTGRPFGVLPSSLDQACKFKEFYRG